MLRVATAQAQLPSPSLALRDNIKIKLTKLLAKTVEAELILTMKEP